MTTLLTSQNSSFGMAVQSGVSVTLLTFLGDTVNLMLPFIIVSVVLIAVDLYFGVPAAKLRGDRVSFSRGIRMTTNKIVEYICWIVLSASLAVAFEWAPLNWIILTIVIGNEMISIISNWMLLKGKKIKGLDEALIHWLGDKVGADASGVTVEDVPVKKSRKK